MNIIPHKENPIQRQPFVVVGGVFRRWCTFNLVGVLGVGVQLLVLALMHEGLGWHYLPATALSVESAILHNFLWHERWTWSDRPGSWRNSMLRLVRFNMAAGIISIGGNLLLMSWLVGRLGMPLLLGNLAAIGACSLLNFLISHHFVFQPSRRVC